MNDKKVFGYLSKGFFIFLKLDIAKNTKNLVISNGRAMKAYPDWFLKNQPRPSKRKAFSVWYYYRKDSKLEPAGLVGPVRFIFEDPLKL